MDQDEDELYAYEPNTMELRYSIIVVFVIMCAFWGCVGFALAQL
jgi:hypothetical protein